MASQYQVIIDRISKKEVPIKYKMSNKAAYDFICDIDRYEASEDPKVWIKAVRSVLHHFGFDSTWVDSEFYDMIYKFYRYDLDFISEDK